MNNLRLTLVIALIFVSYLLWDAWQQDYGPRPEPRTTEQQNGAPTARPPADDAETPEPVPDDGGDVPAGVAAELPGATQGDTPDSAPRAGRTDEPRVVVETDVLRVAISGNGATLSEAYLLDYPEDVDRPDDPIRLLANDPGNVFLIQSGLLSDESRVPDHRAVFTAARDRYVLDAAADTLDVPLTWEGDGVRVTKTYTFTRGSYVVDVVERVENTAGEALAVREYRQLQRTPRQDDGGFSLTNPERYSYFGAAVYSPEDRYIKVEFDEMEERRYSREITGGWAAMVQHYFFAAWLPPEDEANFYYSNVHQPGGAPRYIIGAMSPQVEIPGGGSHEFNSRLYAGPKLQDELEDVAPGLPLTVDYGIFTILAQPLFWLLSLVHSLVGNWGWAIIGVTILIRLAFFKLTETQFKSTAKMRKLQPKMKSLKERYGDDKQKLNQAMMELYKKEKVNPLGGCLPLLVQIPFLIAFYWVLLESVELRQAPFMFWLNDLSSPDPYYILPLIMGATMFIQQKMTPMPTADPMQEKMMMMLPLVFTIMFAFFQSGLVLYWTVNNALSVLQQWFITKRIDAEPDKKGK